MNRYSKIRLLSKESLVSTYLVEDRLNHGRFFDLKVFKFPEYTNDVHKALASSPENNREKSDFLTLLTRLTKGRHPFCALYNEVLVHDGTIYAVCEHITPGVLSSLIEETHRLGQQLNETLVLRWIVQLCLALIYLESCGIMVYRLPISCGGVAAFGNNLTAKLIDFELYCHLESTNSSVNARHNKNQRRQSLISQLGIMAFELLTLKKFNALYPPSLEACKRLSKRCRAVLTQMIFCQSELPNPQETRRKLNKFQDIFSFPSMKKILRALLQENPELCKLHPVLAEMFTNRTSRMNACIRGSLQHPLDQTTASEDDDSEFETTTSDNEQTPEKRKAEILKPGDSIIEIIRHPTLQTIDKPIGRDVTIVHIPDIDEKVQTNLRFCTCKVADVPNAIHTKRVTKSFSCHNVPYTNKINCSNCQEACCPSFYNSDQDFDVHNIESGCEHHSALGQVKHCLCYQKSRTKCKNGNAVAETWQTSNNSFPNSPETIQRPSAFPYSIPQRDKLELSKCPTTKTITESFGHLLSHNNHRYKSPISHQQRSPDTTRDAFPVKLQKPKAVPLTTRQLPVSGHLETSSQQASPPDSQCSPSFVTPFFPQEGGDSFFNKGGGGGVPEPPQAAARHQWKVNQFQNKSADVNDNNSDGDACPIITPQQSLLLLSTVNKIPSVATDTNKECANLLQPAPPTDNSNEERLESNDHCKARRQSRGRIDRPTMASLARRKYSLKKTFEDQFVKCSQLSKSNENHKCQIIPSPNENLRIDSSKHKIAGKCQNKSKYNSTPLHEEPPWNTGWNEFEQINSPAAAAAANTTDSKKNSTHKIDDFEKKAPIIASKDYYFDKHQLQNKENNNNNYPSLHSSQYDKKKRQTLSDRFKDLEINSGNKKGHNIKQNHLQEVQCKPKANSAGWLCKETLIQSERRHHLNATIPGTLPRRVCFSSSSLTHHFEKGDIASSNHIGTPMTQTTTDCFDTNNHNSTQSTESQETLIDFFGRINTEGRVPYPYDKLNINDIGVCPS